MNIKLDENMPKGLVYALKKLGHDVETVPQEGLQGRPDDQIGELSQSEKRFLVTQDLDFSDIKKYAPGSHFGMMIVRLKTPSRRSLIQKVEEAFKFEDTSKWKSGFLILTDQKLRIHGSGHSG